MKHRRPLLLTLPLTMHSKLIKKDQKTIQKECRLVQIKELDNVMWSICVLINYIIVNSTNTVRATCLRVFSLLATVVGQ